MSMIGAWASYHVAEIRSETPSDSLCTHTTRFLPSPAKYETGWYFSVNKEDRCWRDFWLMLCTFPKDKIKEFSACLCFEQNTRCQNYGRWRREDESWNMIRYTCITEEVAKALDRFCKDLRSAEVSPQLVISCFCIMAIPTAIVQWRVYLCLLKNPSVNDLYSFIKKKK